MSDEQIVLLDEVTLLSKGTAPKIASHHAKTPLHLAFSCWLFDDQNRLLLTKRAKSKKVWPAVWTNSFCGHPAPNESLEAAIMRRAQYELGIAKLDNLRVVLPDYRYISPPYNGIIENEFCPVYFAGISSTQEIVPNPQEVAKYEFVEPKIVRDKIAESPDRFSYWFKEQLNILSTRGILNE